MREKRKGSLVGEGKHGKVCEVIRKSMPQAASHIDEKIISLLHRWLVKKNNPNLSKKLERKWAPSRELIKGFFVSFLSWESHRNKFWLRLRGGEPSFPLLPLLFHCPSLLSPLTLCHGAQRRPLVENTSPGCFKSLFLSFKSPNFKGPEHTPSFLIY